MHNCKGTLRKHMQRLHQSDLAPPFMQQYWAGDPDVYAFVGVAQLAQAFKDSGISSDHNGDSPDVEAGDNRDSKQTSKQAGNGVHKQPSDGLNGSAQHAKHGKANSATEHQGDGRNVQGLDPLVRET